MTSPHFIAGLLVATALVGCRSPGEWESRLDGVGTPLAVQTAASCDDGLAASCTSLGDMFLEGREGAPSGLNDALALFARGCELGDESACENEAGAVLDYITENPDDAAAVARAWDAAIAECSAANSDCAALGRVLAIPSVLDVIELDSDALPALDTQCAAGTLPACELMIRLVTIDAGFEPTAVETAALVACRAGLDASCDTLGGGRSGLWYGDLPIGSRTDRQMLSYFMSGDTGIPQSDFRDESTTVIQPAALYLRMSGADANVVRLAFAPATARSGRSNNYFVADADPYYVWRESDESDCMHAERLRDDVYHITIDACSPGPHFLRVVHPQGVPDRHYLLELPRPPTACGDPAFRPEDVTESAWGSYICENPRYAQDREGARNTCLARRDYTDEAYRGCPDDDLCCPEWVFMEGH